MSCVQCTKIKHQLSLFTQATTTPPPADVCGCMNGGTCIIRTIRGRVFRLCACPDGFTGLRCETSTYI